MAFLPEHPSWVVPPAPNSLELQKENPRVWKCHFSFSRLEGLFPKECKEYGRYHSVNCGTVYSVDGPWKLCARRRWLGLGFVFVVVESQVKRRFRRGLGVFRSRLGLLGCGVRGCRFPFSTL